jgi:hypothetical protein
VLVPADSRSGTERLGDPVDRLQSAQRTNEPAGPIQRSIRVGKGECLLVGQPVRLGGWPAADVPTRSLATQPLGHVPLIAFSPRRQLDRGRGVLRQSAVQPQPVPDNDASCRDRRTQVADETAEKLVELVLIHGVLQGRCGCFGFGLRLDQEPRYAEKPLRGGSVQPVGHRPCGDTRPVGNVQLALMLRT